MIYFILGVIFGIVALAVAQWLFDKPERQLPDDNAWQRGFDAGGSDYQADWMFALDDVVPETTDIGPMAIRRYILALQEDVHRGSH